MLRHMDPGEWLRHSASGRFAGQIESMAQAVAQRAIDLVVDSVDVNALIDRIDLNAVLARVNLNALLARVDLNEVLDEVDLDEVLDRVDLNKALDRVDLNKLMAQVDINEIAGRVDFEALAKNTNLGAVLASSTTTVATEAVDLGRSHAVRMDDTLARWVSRLRRDHIGPAEPPSALEGP
jgi:hypothetical protein